MALFSRATHPRDVVTLYAESTDLRYLATEGGRVSRWGSVPLPEGLVTEGLITDAAEMGRIIDELFQEQALLRKRVITGICALRSIPRLLTLPRLQASLLEEAISREAKKEMPISLEICISRGNLCPMAASSSASISWGCRESWSTHRFTLWRRPVFRPFRWISSRWH